jgi:hypothetical protein
MTPKAGNWLIGIGASIIFVGLCCMPAAFGDQGDSTLLGFGASLFGMGALFMAAGVYTKARGLQSQAGSKDAESAAAPRTRGGCELCGSDVPVIHCRVHQLHLCSTCLAEHFDPRSCSYVPPTRRPAAKGAKGLARARGV